MKQFLPVSDSSLSDIHSFGWCPHSEIRCKIDPDGEIGRQRYPSEHKNAFLWPYELSFPFRNFSHTKFNDRDPAGSPTFAEFAAFVINNGTTDPSDGDFDVHVKPYWHTCDMCRIDFDVIGKTETFEADTEFIMRSANFKVDSLPPEKRRLNASRGGREATEKIAKRLFKSLPENVLKKLLHIYAFDLTAFGYKVDDVKSISRR